MNKRQQKALYRTQTGLTTLKKEQISAARRLQQQNQPLVKMGTH